MRNNNEVSVKVPKEINKELLQIKVDTDIDIKDSTEILLRFAIDEFKRNPTILTKTYAKSLAKESK